MSAPDDLQRDVDWLRQRNQVLEQRLAESERAVVAMAHGEIDSVTVEGTGSPLLLHAAQEALRRNESLFRAVIEKCAEAISLTARDGTTRYLTPSAWRLLGWTPDELGDRTLRDLVLEEDRSRIADALDQLVSSGARDMTLEFRVRHRDGSIHWIESSGTNLLEDPDVRAIVGNYRDVTSRKRVEIALRESRDLLEEAQSISHVGSWESGLWPDGEIHWSPECYRIFGIAPGTPMTVQSFYGYLHPDDRERMRLTTRAAIDQGAPAEIEHRIIRPDGRVCRVYQRGLVERDEAGRAVRMIGTVEDITARHEAVEALRASELRYRRIVESTSEGVWLCDADGTTTFMNARMAEMVGYTIDEVVGLPIYAFREEASRPAIRAAILRREAGIAERTESKLMCKDGSELLVSMQMNPFFAPGGRFEGALALVTDVSAQRRADEARARLVAIVDSSDDAIMGLSLEAIVTSWNLAAEKLYQYSAVEMTGTSIYRLVPPSSWDDEGRILERSARGEPVRHYEVTHCRKDGSTVEVAITVSPVRDATGTIIGLSKIARDLTVQRQTEAMLRRTEEQFRQTQKMEAVGRLAAGVAHDFNNLLSVILSYTSLALEDLKTGDPLRRDMAEIHAAGERAAELTRQLLAFSRQQVLQPVRLDLHDVVSRMTSMLDRVLGDDIELTVTSSPGMGCVLADPGQIEQVLMNLALNARDAMPTGGELTIALGAVALDAAAAVSLGVAEGDYVMMSVHDTGTGMDAATTARIFEPFFTTKPMGKGTGLGLATVFGIVKQSGGSVVVESEPGRGTTFEVYLAKSEGPYDTIISGPPAPETLRGSETILLVEDDDQVRAVACAILRRSGYHVLETSNGGEALLVSSDFEAEIDLLLTDVIMPRMSGRRLADGLKRARPDMRVLFASGYTDDALVHHDIAHDSASFLQKPFTSTVLLHKVRAVLDARRSVTEV